MAHHVETSAFVKLVVAEHHSTAALAQARLMLDGLTLLAVSTEVCERAAELDPSILRSLDALHLATALMLGDQLQSVVTHDDRLAAACPAHGVAVIHPH